MRKVKRFKVKKAIKGFSENDIFIQYFDRPFIYYAECSGWESGAELNIKDLFENKKSDFSDYFSHLTLIDVSETEYYIRRMADIKKDLEVIEDAIIDLQRQKQQLLKFIRID